MESENRELFMDELTRQYDKLGQEIREKMEIQAALGLTRAFFQGLSSSELVPSVQIHDHISQTGPGKQVGTPEWTLPDCRWISLALPTSWSGFYG